MTKVKMLTGMAGNDFAYSPQQIVEVDDKIAKSWIDAGIAEVGDSNGVKGGNSSKSGTGKPGGSKAKRKG